MVIFHLEIDEKIALVEAQIVEVEAQIKQAGEQEEKNKDNLDERNHWRKKEDQLRKKEEQLRKKEEQLRDEKKILLQHGGMYSSVLYNYLFRSQLSVFVSLFLPLTINACGLFRYTLAFSTSVLSF
jgi:hypothetical protein